MEDWACELVEELKKWMVVGLTKEQQATIEYLVKTGEDGKRLRAFIALEIAYAKNKLKNQKRGS